MSIPTRFPALPAIRPGWVIAFVLLAGALIHGAAIVFRPPLGGTIALAVLLVGIASVAILLQRPGLFLAGFLVYAILAPFLSRFLGLPLGWLKGSFFMAVLPVWLLSRSRTPDGAAWLRSVRIPRLCVLASGIVLVSLGLVSVVRGIAPLQVFNTLKSHLLYPPLLFMAAESAGNPRQVRRFLWLVSGASAVVAAGGILQAFLPVDFLVRLGLRLETGAVAYVAVDPLSGSLFQRVFSFLDDQIALASFCFTGIALALYLLGEARGARRAFLWIGVALCALALILTYNITVACGTMLFLFILAVRWRNPRFLGGLFLGLCAVALLGWFQFGELLRNRVTASFSVETGVTTSLNARLASNAAALRMILDAPLIGQGLGSTANSLIYYRLGMRPNILGGLATDNFYMTTALEAGLIGFAALLLLHILPLWGAVRLGRSRDEDARRFSVLAGTAVVVFMVMNLSNAPMNTNPTNLLYWMLAGLLWRKADAA